MVKNSVKIAHISDMHMKVGDTLSEKLHYDIIKDLENQKPDLILYTGDLIDASGYKNFPSNDPRLKYINGTEKKVSCPGNHDKVHQSPKELDVTERENFDWANCDAKHKTDLRPCFQDYIKKFNIIDVSGIGYEGLTDFHSFIFDINQGDKLRIGVFTLNNSWFTIAGKVDNNRLTIGREPLKKAIEEYIKVNKEKPFDFILTIMHHPKHYIRYSEFKENEHFKLILKKSDYIFYGHTHKQSMITKAEILKSKNIECGALHYNFFAGYLHSYFSYLELKKNGNHNIIRFEKSAIEYIKLLGQDQKLAIRKDFLSLGGFMKFWSHFYISKAKIWNTSSELSNQLRDIFGVQAEQDLSLEAMVYKVLDIKIFWRLYKQVLIDNTFLTTYSPPLNAMTESQLKELNYNWSDENLISKIKEYFVIKYKITKRGNVISMYYKVDDLQPDNKCIVTTLFSEMYGKSDPAGNAKGSLEVILSKIYKLKNRTHTYLALKILWSVMHMTNTFDQGDDAYNKTSFILVQENRDGVNNVAETEMTILKNKFKNDDLEDIKLALNIDIKWK